MARTLVQARQDAAENLRELHRGQRRAAHLKLASLRAAEERLRTLRGVELREARAVCRVNVREAFEQSRARFAEATARARAARDASRSEAKSACDASTKKMQAHRDREIAEAHAIRVAEWREQQELAGLDSWAEQKGRSRAKKVERKAESDQEVASNLEPHELALWRQVKRGIKGSARLSRTEEFRQYIEQHPDELEESWGDADPDEAALRAEEERYFREGNPGSMLPVLVLANPAKKGRKSANPPDDDAARERRFAEYEAAEAAKWRALKKFERPGDIDPAMTAREDAEMGRKMRAFLRTPEGREQNPKQAEDFDKVRRQLHRAHQATVNYHRRENETYAQAEVRRDKLQARYEQLNRDFDRLYPYEHNPTTQRPASAGKKGTPMAQTPAQKAASKRNIKKAIASNRKKAKPRKRAKNPESNPAKKRTRSRKRKPTTGARRPRARKNPASNPHKRRRRRNPEGSSGKGRGMVAAQIGGGVLVGGAGAGAAEYLMSGTTALATPPRRAIAHAVVGTVIGAAGVMWPRASAFFAGAAGAFFGVAGKNAVQALWSGSPKSTSTAKGGTGSGDVMARVVMPSAMHQLPAANPLRAVTMNRNQLRSVVMRGGKY